MLLNDTKPVPFRLEPVLHKLTALITTITIKYIFIITITSALKTTYIQRAKVKSGIIYFHNYTKGVA